MQTFIEHQGLTCAVGDTEMDCTQDPTPHLVLDVGKVVFKRPQSKGKCGRPTHEVTFSFTSSLNRTDYHHTR